MTIRTATPEDAPVDRFSRIIRAIHIQALRDRRKIPAEVKRYFDTGIGTMIHYRFFGGRIPE